MNGGRVIRVPCGVLRQAVAELTPAELAETAVPSYCHANPPIRWLFWKRLDTAIQLACIRPADRTLDFGTGSGALLPTLHQRTRQVAATDVDVRPALALVASLALPTEVVAWGDFADWASTRRGAFDLILALDVLEHVGADELALLGGRLPDLLAPGGRLVVCGPTETVIYGLARRAAGFGRGAYHHRSIYDVDAVLRRHWTAEESRVIPWMPQAFVLTRYVPTPGA